MKKNKIQNKLNGKREYFFTIIVTFVVLVLIEVYTFGSYYLIARQDTIIIGQKSVEVQSERLNNFLLKGMDVLQVTGLMVDYMLQTGSTRDEIEAYLQKESEDYSKYVEECFTGIYGVFDGAYIDGIRMQVIIQRRVHGI